MGRFLNKGNRKFAEFAKTKYFVDKTALINQLLKKDITEKFICLSRPRRFGKTLNMNMLECFFSTQFANRGDLFEGLSIWSDEKYRKMQGTYPVITLTFADVKSNTYEAAITRIKQNFTELYNNHEFLLEGNLLNEKEKEQFAAVKPDMRNVDAEVAIRALTGYLSRYYGKRVIILLDEYDTPLQEAYIGGYWEEMAAFIRSLFNVTFKTNPHLSRAILTGITRVSKESIFSDLNNLEVVTTTSDAYAAVFGFTEEEVKGLCEQYHMDFFEMSSWYDGYTFTEYQHIYNPKSVVEAVRRHKLSSYWTSTETYDALKVYIDMDFDGLRSDIVQMLGGGSVKINTRSFQNDMRNFKTKDDVLTLLIHLGYLAYDASTQKAFIPNKEIIGEFENAMSVGGWSNVMNVLKASEKLLEETLQGHAELAAEELDKAHSEVASILTYNDENSLGCAIGLAYYSARKDYKLVRELPAGKGFADIAFLPLPHTNKPALIVELKYDKSVSAAIQQIKDRQYTQAFEAYVGEILLVGIKIENEK